ncbi:hypothetical protein BDP27DRAFT_1427500 [Rhodocollybia butyracea]|uniref:Uncharacterized protein n=1 Tax=Rhodocollybia butyracea TaxID=206335 RepID=A0A9P5U1W1_9AGAR|nr:hypothetical protein BDP27DRAFT_1427500 [Rhodocollybia butyracea]
MGQVKRPVAGGYFRRQVQPDISNDTEAPRKPKKNMFRTISAKVSSTYTSLHRRVPAPKNPRQWLLVVGHRTTPPPFPLFNRQTSASPNLQVLTNSNHLPFRPILSLAPRPISETLDKVLAHLARAMNTGSVDSEPDDDEDDEDEDYTAMSDDDIYMTAPSNAMNMTRLQHHFLEIVAREYRPGLIRFGGDDFCISVSLSVVKLAESIPARALMAWDRRLLSKCQNLALLISDLRGVYPFGRYEVEVSRWLKRQVQARQRTCERVM